MAKDKIITFDEEQKCLYRIKGIIKENPTLAHFSSFFNDAFLLHFIRGRKYNCDVAYDTLNSYISMRTGRHNKFFKTLRPKGLTILEEDNHLHVFKYSNGPENRLVLYDRVVEWNPAKFQLDEVIKKGLLIFEEAWNEKSVELNGLVMIFDVANISFNRISPLCNVFVWQKTIDLFVKSFPMKVKEIHLVHDNFLLNSVLKVVLPLCPRKIQERLHAHGQDMKSLHKFLPPDILPKSLGGFLTDDEAFQDTEFFQRVREKDEYYRKFIEKL